METPAPGRRPQALNARGEGALLYTGPAGFMIGRFRRYPSQVPFTDTGPVTAHLMVFPRTPVIIQHAGHPPVVADPTRVILYNRGQEYTRRALSLHGDQCEWFAAPAEAIAEAAREQSPGVDDRLDRPFASTHREVDARTYLLQRRVAVHVSMHARPDHLFVEESIMTLLGRCVGPPHPSSLAVRTTTARAHRELAEACRVLLSRRLASRLSLSGIAAGVGTSPFHLARVFRKESGLSVHAYLHQLRLRTALSRVMDGEDLTNVALDLGYASHSHFTARFRRMFGAPPSSLRG